MEGLKDEVFLIIALRSLVTGGGGFFLAYVDYFFLLSKKGSFHNINRESVVLGSLLIITNCYSWKLSVF